MKKLFPLNTFQQDAVLKRLGELSQGLNEKVDLIDLGTDSDLLESDTVEGLVPGSFVDCNGEKLYVVSKSEEHGCYLARLSYDGSGMHVAKYVYSEEEWSFDDYYDYALVPVPTSDDEGKVPVVNASGKYELGSAGGTQLYKHKFGTGGAANIRHIKCLISGMTWSYESISNTLDFEVISKTQTPYTKINDLQNDEDNIVSIHVSVAGTRKIFSCVVEIVPNSSLLDISYYTGNATQFDFYSSSITTNLTVTDTVSKL